MFCIEHEFAELHRMIDRIMDKAIDLLPLIYKDFVTRIMLVFDKRMEGESNDDRFGCYLAWEYQDKLEKMYEKLKEEFDHLMMEANAQKEGVEPLKKEELELWQNASDEFNAKAEEDFDG